MDPVAFTIFGRDVRWYGLLIASAVLIGTLLALRETKRKGLEEETLIDFLLFAIPSAIVGARLYFVIFSWDIYRDNPIQALNIRSGGLAIHGAIIAGFIVAIIFTKIRKIKLWQLADIVAPSLVLGQAIGRWGNYANQEAYGRPTDLPWAIEINGVGVHPTFLYESVFNLMIFVFLMWYRKKSETDGEIFLLYFSLYSLGRFFIEGLRTDSLMIGPIRVAQLISVLIILSCILLLYYRKKKSKS